MQMMRLISFHWIDSFSQASENNRNKIDKIESKYAHSGGNFSTSNDGKCRNKKAKHNSARIPNNNISSTVKISKNKRRRKNNRENHKNKSTIFLSSKCRIGQVELDSKKR